MRCRRAAGYWHVGQRVGLPVRPPGHQHASPPCPSLDVEWGRELVDTWNVSFVSVPEVHDLFMYHSFVIVLLNLSRVVNQVEFMCCKSDLE